MVAVDLWVVLVAAAGVLLICLFCWCCCCGCCGLPRTRSNPSLDPWNLVNTPLPTTSPDPRGSLTYAPLSLENSFNPQQSRVPNSYDNAPSNYIVQAKYWFEQSYPNWKDALLASLDATSETICIPDALDVLRNRRLDTNRRDQLVAGEASSLQTFKQDMVGQRGEDTFFKAFRQLNLGGIMISGFNTEEFISKMNKEGVFDFNYGKWKEEKRHFECDAFFIHRQLGAFIIEIKGCDKHNIEKRFNKASVQLDKIITGMEEIYHKTTEKFCPINFHGIICIPNADVSKTHHKFKFIGKNDINDARNFKNFWIPIPNHDSLLLHHLSGQSTSESVEDDGGGDLHSFLALIIGCRSAKVVSLPSNVMEIYRIIEQQEFARVKKQDTPSANDQIRLLQLLKTESIFLNSEQLDAVECTKQHIIISGPPGTGKTIVMLLRALAAAKLEKPGRVFILPTMGGKELVALFRKFIADNWNAEEFKREVIVADYFAGMLQRNSSNLNDDLFCDEIPLDDASLSVFLNYQNIWGNTSISEVAGTTTLILTGWRYPQYIAENMSAAFSFFPDFHHIQLKRVIRGTFTIINEWKRFFPHQFVQPGHNVKGASVQRIALNGFPLVLNTICDKVESFLRRQFIDSPTSSFLPRSEDRLNFEPRHIAILLSDEYGENRISEIKEHLTAKQFPCGDFVEQINDINLIAVGPSQRALSLDWPVVIYLKHVSQKNEEKDLLPLSRCISKLLIIVAGAETEPD